MQRDPGPILRLSMEKAARLRAAGMSWAVIAQKLKRTKGTCLHWPCKFPAAWAQLYSDALAERDDDAEAESIGTLREMLRVKDAKVQREAARDLLRLMRRHDRRMRAAALIDHPLGNHSNENIEAFIRAFDPDAQGPAPALRPSPRTGAE